MQPLSRPHRQILDNPTPEITDVIQAVRIESDDEKLTGISLRKTLDTEKMWDYNSAPK